MLSEIYIYMCVNIYGIYIAGIYMHKYIYMCFVLMLILSYTSSNFHLDSSMYYFLTKSSVFLIYVIFKGPSRKIKICSVLPDTITHLIVTSSKLRVACTVTELAHQVSQD